jgi:DNA-binding helix-hairpin-helix protein with protein kinase domain
MPKALSTSKLIDQSGNLVSLAPKPFAVGGEGEIYELAGDPSTVAKVYKSAVASERSEKLIAMASASNPDILKIAAWPTGTLHVKPGGPVAGILMPRISGFKEIHHLYSVAQRKKDFPEASWKFLIHTAMNCAAAFERIHQNSHVVGDVNQKNVMVSSSALVKFVDCDSFQVNARGGRNYRCLVGVPEYTPPELHDKSFRDVDRNSNHDCFGLAVLIFHLLMMGRHPYSGVYTQPGEMPLEKAIKEGRFAYHPDPKLTLMKAPPNTVPFAILDATITSLFLRAFAPLGKNGSPVRPGATEWKEALQAFLKQLGECTIDAKHVYPRSTPACPWCKLLGSTGVLFFPPSIPVVDAKTKKFDLLAVWAEIQPIAFPEEQYSRPLPKQLAPVVAKPIPPLIPAPTPLPILAPVPPAPANVDRFFDYVASIGVAVGLMLLFIAPPVGTVCFIGFSVWALYLNATLESRKKSQRDEHRAIVRNIEHENAVKLGLWRASNREWDAEHAVRLSERTSVLNKLSELESAIGDLDVRARDNFHRIYADLKSMKNVYEEAKALYTKEVADLLKRSNNLQLARYLDSQLIGAAKLQGITNSRVMSLRSFGLESALDVDKLLQIKVPGVGPKSIDKLFGWKRSLERNFTPKPGLPDSERAIVDQKHVGKLRQMESVLTGGPTKLRAIIEQHRTKKEALREPIQQTVNTLEQANANVALMESALAAATS